MTEQDSLRTHPLFHGTSFPARPFDLLKPFVAPDALPGRQLDTPYIYATPYRSLALAYILKERFGRSVGITCAHGASSFVTFIAHGSRKESAEAYFHKMMAHEGYLTRLDSASFLPRVSAEPDRPVPAEWLSAQPAQILAVAKLSGFQAIAKGNVQLFTILKPEESEARRDQLEQAGPQLQLIGKMVAEGFLRWENERPAFRDRNPKRHRQLARHYEIG